MKNNASSTADTSPVWTLRVRPSWVALVLLLAIVCLLVTLKTLTMPARRVGATAIVTEVGSGLRLEGRVDTGAEVCSLHVEEIDIRDGSPDPGANVGKMARLLLKNKQGEAKWIETRLVDHTPIRTADYSEERYYVHLSLRLGDVQKTVLATLNDRASMKHPLLLGRNFLRRDFVVDVNLDSDDFE